MLPLKNIFDCFCTTMNPGHHLSSSAIGQTYHQSLLVWSFTTSLPTWSVSTLLLHVAIGASPDINTTCLSLLPWLAFPNGTFFVFPHTKGIQESFNLPNSVSYHISCGDWLVFSCKGSCFLMDPFSKVNLTLPDLSCFCPMDEPDEIINDHVIIEEEMPDAVLMKDTEVSLC